VTESDAWTWADVDQWRKGERERLIHLRLDIPAATRAEFAGRIATGIDAVIGKVEGLMVSFYWPFRGEPDLRPWAARVVANGGKTALPLIVDHGLPLKFRAWKLGDKLQPGIWNIPAPAEGEDVIPDVIIVPLVGWDRQFYRLGHGGGFFDRTLEALSVHAPKVIGIGYSATELKTIHPQPHDIPMQVIVTEKGVLV